MMNTQILVEKAAPEIYYPSQIVEPIYYASEVGEEMGETAIHFKQITLLFNLLEAFLALRHDVLLAADLVVYYEESQPQKWYAPDVFVCFGVDNGLRRTFKAWEEGVFPQVVFEVASSSTFEIDLGGKRLEYARLGVQEYYLLDPHREYLPAPLMAFHQNEGRLMSVSVHNDRVLSPLLGLEIVDAGELFRLFDPQKNRFLRTLAEAEAEIARLIGEN